MSGLQLRDGMQGSLRVLGFAANLHILLLIDQERQPLAHQGMIVDNQDGFLAGLRRSFKNHVCCHRHFPSSERRRGGTCR